MSWTENTNQSTDAQFYAYFTHDNGVQVAITLVQTTPEAANLADGTAAMEDVVDALSQVQSLTFNQAGRQYAPNSASYQP